VVWGLVIKTYQYSRNAHKIASWLVDQGFTLQNAIGRSIHFPRDIDISKRNHLSLIYVLHEENIGVNSDMDNQRGNYIGPLETPNTIGEIHLL
jgi:hypothetical protein